VPAGTDNAICRFGDDRSVRLARRKGPTRPGGKEFDWLPTLAPLLPLEIPVLRGCSRVWLPTTRLRRLA